MGATAWGWFRFSDAEMAEKTRLSQSRRHIPRRLLLFHFPYVNSPRRLFLGQERIQGDENMGKRDELIAHYTEDLRTKCGVEPDLQLLEKVTIGCGPAIYDPDASTVAATQPGELETVKRNFLVKKLGLSDGPDLDAGIGKVIETYGHSERNKYRAVVYYLLVKHFSKESAYH